MADEHLRSHHYVDIDGSGGSASMLAQRTHRHLVETCPECRAEWEQLGGLQEAYRSTLNAFTTPKTPSGPSDDDLLVDDRAIAAQEEVVRQHRRLRRRAQRQIWELRRTPANQRAGKIRAAWRRFRSLGFVELLIEESRSLVRNSPEEALHWIDLVPVALDRARGLDDAPWLRGLLARAAGHRANALRILGDLRGAEQAFAEVRRSMAARPLGDPGIVAEVTRLEASLRMAQQDNSHAEELLDRAALAYRYAGDGAGLARTRIKHAMLLRSQGRIEEALPLLDQAAKGLAAGTEPVEPYLALSIITEKVNGLCHLGRFEQAGRLLRKHLDDYEAGEDPHIGATFRGLQGRVELGLEEFEKAEDSFASARDGFLTLGRSHDAALASLYLAEALLAQGRTTELRRLAAQLVKQFRSSDVAVETARALRLFGQAAVAETVTAALLAKLRDNLARANALTLR